jgi:aryl-alcohol dehydrogenase-like predicted oxidoreductase
MILRSFGVSSLRVSALGLGAGEIGDSGLEETHVEQLLHAALDEGITLIDTARGYGMSEERIGRHLSHRRSSFVLSTKVGYGIEGMPDWTYDTVIAGVEQACRTMRTDRIDIVHLHSCPRSTTEHAGVLDALEECVRRGLVVVPAYSGENDDLDFAVHTGRIRSIQLSVNLFDQRCLDGVIPEAQRLGMGVIAKRPLGNAPWRFPTVPKGQYSETYWHRMQAMGSVSDVPWDELALRFAAYAPGVHSCIPGTTSIDRLRHNATLVRRGPLPEETIHGLRTAFRNKDDGWRGEV